MFPVTCSRVQSLRVGTKTRPFAALLTEGANGHKNHDIRIFFRLYLASFNKIQYFKYNAKI